MHIRGMTSGDWPAVQHIYADGIAGGHATFETSAPSWEEFDGGRLPHLRLVAVGGGGDGDARDEILGWAAGSPTSGRAVYRGVVEHSVYVAASASGRGIGHALLDALTRLSEAVGVWTLRSGVFPENLASLALHRRCGFTTVGPLERVGLQDGRWRDVLLLERRSTAVGLDEPLVRLAAGGSDGPEYAAVRRLLGETGLPTEGLGDAWLVWVADAAGTTGDIVGASALERHLSDRPPTSTAYLLRSVVVADPYRGTGLGARLVRAALTTADILEVHDTADVSLLTETADGWFDRFGFVPVQRDDLPSALLASPELRGVCSASARAYHRGPRTTA